MSGPADATSGFGGARDHATATWSARKPRVYLECTTTYASKYNTGIQRTVRSIVDAALHLPGHWVCVPIIFNGRYFEAIDRLPAPRRADLSVAYGGIENLRRAFHFARTGAIRFLPFAALRARVNSPWFEFALRRAVYAMQNLRRWGGSFGRRGGRIAFEPGDVVVLLDATWGIDVSRELRRARAGGARVWTVVQDLIPINHPDIAPEGLPLLLDAWLRRTIPLSDGLLAISDTVADDLRAYTRNRIADSERHIDSFYLGAGFDPAPAREADLARITGAFHRCLGDVYLVVGTIEPRKDCGRILAAFERLWAEGSDLALMLFGRAGWRSYDLIDTMHSHPELGTRLFWFEDGSDAELDFAYRHAVALIFASRCEGFGLPLVEAMQYGLPVLASDIPVFREIGGDYPDFFPPGDESAIYDAVRRFADSRISHPNAMRTPKPWPSWSESARTLLDKVTARLS
ncbi:MAG: glycosyltransferase family 1 protein [Betaproteobacteria bacterium]